MKVARKLPAGLLPLSLLLGVVTLMMLLASAPFMYLADLDQTISRNRASLSQLRAVISREGELRQENVALAALGQDESLLLEGDTTGIAGANLQKLMNRVIVQHGGTASSFQILQPQAEGSFMRIPMSLSISVGTDALRDILYDVETSTPLIFIDDITVRSTQHAFRTPDPHYLGPLDVTLQISGYLADGERSER